ncbi:hypothetical protein PsorP6_018511 [Peronosclerospora sorghi]|nr:hypothetical protein PsorP6_018511 [Peronosclerospora sorghi]
MEQTQVTLPRGQLSRLEADLVIKSRCEARATDGRLQCREQQQIRTSRFLFVNDVLHVAEPHAQLFRMAVKGIKLMLENRAIPEDVDVNEVLAKVVASIKYQAFGRAALTDEVDKMLREEMDNSTPLMEICQLVEITRVSSLHLSIPPDELKTPRTGQNDTSRETSSVHDHSRDLLA